MKLLKFFIFIIAVLTIVFGTNSCNKDGDYIYVKKNLSLYSAEYKNNSVILKWSEVYASDFTQYEIYRTDDYVVNIGGSRSFIKIAIINDRNTTSYTDFGPFYYEHFSYYIVCKDQTTRTVTVLINRNTK